MHYGEGLGTSLDGGPNIPISVNGLNYIQRSMYLGQLSKRQGIAVGVPITQSFYAMYHYFSV